MADEKKVIPAPVIQRLPQYLSYVRDYRNEHGDGASNLRSHDIARALGLTTSTVRQDFTHLDFYGVSQHGYDVALMEKVLAHTLGLDSKKNLVIIGAGNMGRALATNGNFGRFGFCVRGIFDIDPGIVGDKVGDLVVQHVEQLTEFVAGSGIEIGVIAVPSKAAQSAADRLVLSGVKGLLNLAFTRVVAPRNVNVVDGRIVSSMLQLSCMMAVSAEEAE
jgi:redox-sensing transcriptional repressor